MAVDSICMVVTWIFEASLHAECLLAYLLLLGVGLA